ncbi:PspC domain-containing protein [Rhodococcus spelaei]|uniref:PspC domain-containing protein n=1 Tax=Rhodococcus spelaei TaxID=2546320 RepID=A0A541B0T3_9NOCA|nr:PspC domain-containing protein [Rhodococcus spelaei]TQF65933.1 PspC domain-containing protein [Rhodococcus spelaei]
MSNPSFPDQLQELWRTRPVRLPHRGPLAGVAAGIAHRYDVDPVLVRVAFAVSTIFGGVGIVLYLACWLLLPQAGDQVSAAESMFGRGHSSESGTKKVVLAVALVIAMSTLGPVGVGLGGSGLISLALMLGGLWLLHQRRPVPPPLPAGVDVGFAYPTQPTGYPGTVTPAAEYGGFTTPGVYATLPKTYEPAPTVTAQTAAPSADTVSDAAAPTDPVPTDSAAQPPSWDPLGVAPFAWDLPEPAPATVPAIVARPKSRLTSTVLGVAIIASAATWGVSAASGAQWLSPGRIGAVALAVIGIGLIVGAFLRRGYGLLVVTGPLIGFVMLASLIGPVDWNSQQVGSRTFAPASAAELQSSYSGQLGDFTLDLRSVQLTENKTVDITSGVGSFTVLVPPNMNVENHCSIAIGDVSCLADGLSLGTDGANKPVLTLNMTGKVGDMQVHRG